VAQSLRFGSMSPEKTLIDSKIMLLFFQARKLLVSNQSQWKDFTDCKREFSGSGGESPKE